MRNIILTLTAVLALSGCAPLHLRPTDSTTKKAAKVVARVPVAVVTFGVSEVWHQRERVMSSWLGHHESDLIMSWGPPYTVLGDGMGGRILVYTESRTSVTPGQSTTTSRASAYGQAYGNQIYVQGQGESQTTYTPARVQQWQVYRQFRVNSSGQIVEYSWRGL